MIRRSFRSFVLLAALLAASPVRAQTNERIYEELDFRFVTPGARAVGMGHTFVGLADDATAARSNPAGLSNLLEPEFSFEFNGTQIRHRRLLPGDPSGSRTFGDFVLVPSFFSYAIPLRRATLLLFRDTVQQYRETFTIPPRFIPELGAHEDGAFGSIAERAENYGIGAAFVLSPRVSVGGSLVLATLDVATEGRSGERIAPRNGTTTIDSGFDVGATVGVQVKPRPSVTLGAAYYQGATFQVTTTLFGNFRIRGIDVPLTGEQRDVDYVIPDRLAAGGAWRARNNLTVVADVAHIRYSRQITRNFLVVDFQDPDAGLNRDNFYIRNATELHAGAEYRQYGVPLTWTLRGGVFTEPEHQMHFRRGRANPGHFGQAFLDYRFNTLRQATTVGATAGAGLTLHNRVQIDGAVSLGRTSRQFVVSTVVRLPRR